MKCQKCGLPMVESFGPGYVLPQCRCWMTFAPAPDAAQGNGCQPARPLTEADVRRIVREDMDARLRNLDLTGSIRCGGAPG